MLLVILRWWACALLLSLLIPRASVDAQEMKLGTDASLTIRGILSGTLFLQDSRFGLGNGQQAEFVTEELEGWWHGGDVRNMRLTFEFRGPEIAGSNWRANATFEADLFGGFNGAGNFGDEQPIPRLRLAYADLTNGRTTIRIGQAWALTLGNIPVSTSHIGFPLGWGSGGFIGWRFPGIFLIQNLSAADARTKAQLQFALMRGSWVDEQAADQPSAGEAGTPQFEARFNVDGQMEGGSWGFYAVGHWDQKDLNNVRPEGAPEPEENDLDSWALEGGARYQRGAFTLHGNAYAGRAMAHHFAHVIQFGDIAGWGAWAQAGVDLTNRWSLWLYGGTDSPDDDEVGESGSDRLGSVLIVPMLRFRLGGYQFGLEWLYNQTEYLLEDGSTEDRTGNQFALSARYDF
jgi:hypothetical protein